MHLAPFFALALFAAAADAPPADAHDRNPLFHELTHKGLPLGTPEPWKFPAPFMPDGLTPEQQQKRLEELADRNFPLKKALDKDLQAPFYFTPNKQLLVPDSNPDAPAYRIDVWFIAYGDLQKLAQKDPSELFASSPGDAKVRPLTDDEMKDRNITLKYSEMPLRERYAHTKAKLEEEIEVHMTSHSFGSLTPESLVVASRVDPAFANDEKLGNTWQRLKPKPGDVQPLGVGGGFYLKITKLAAPKDALFVEFHWVNVEPKAWFGGKAVLRSKIPVWIEGEVRRFRASALKTLD